MAASDFLQLPSGTDLSINSTSTSAPAWYQAYQQSLIAKGSQIAKEPYQAYGGARIAGFTPDTIAAWDRIRSSIGEGSKGIGEGMDMVTAGGNGSAASVASPYFNKALSSSASSAAAPYLNAAMGTSVGDEVKGALEGATKPYTAVYKDYMNPYTDAAVDRMAKVASRNLTENILPGVNSTFTRAGQFGSTRNADITGRAIRDTQEGIAGQAAQMYDKAYADSANIYGADASRIIDAATKYGGFKASDLDRILTGAGIASNAAGTDAALAGQLGTAMGQLSAGDLDRLIKAGATQGDLARALQSSNLTDASALETIGNQIQGQNQKSLDTAYGDFTQQRDYPLRQLQIMQSLLSGQQIPGIGTESVSSAPGQSTSPLATLLSMMMASGSLQGRA